MIKDGILMYFSQQNLTNSDNLQRKMRHKPKKRRKLLVLIIIFFLLLAIIIFFNSSFSRIIDIEVNGATLLTEEEIYKKGKININMQYLFTNTSEIEKKLLQFKEVKEVEVIKEFPGKLTINIVEHKPIALYYSGKEWLPVLENGYLYEGTYKNKYINYPLITKWDNKDTISLLAAELAKVSPSVLLEMSEIQQNPQVYDPNQILIISNKGYKIHVSLDDVGEKLNLYPSIVESIEAKGAGLGNIYLMESIRFEEFNYEQEGVESTN